MITENIEKITEELARLEQFGSDIIGTVIVNRNGLLITSNLPLDLDDRKFGAMAATIYNGIETAVESFKNPEIRHITVEFENYQIIVLGIDKHMIVASLLHLDINLGLILIELEEFILKIREE